MSDPGDRDTRTRQVAGCMTGTSLDGLDVALVEVTGHGPTMQARVLRHLGCPLGEVAEGLRRLAGGEPLPAEVITTLAQQLSTLHIDLLQDLREGTTLDLVAVHGQTIFHAPPLSWQLICPAPIAQALQVPVVFDLRGADLARGGQGAPITPMADWILFREPGEDRAVVNLGGFINYTLLPGEGGASLVTGADLCACNQLLDAVARQHLGCPYDEGGARALTGQVLPGPCQELIQLLEGQAAAGRSLGTGDEGWAWLQRHQGSRGEDLARTACGALAIVLARVLEGCQRVLLAGGGARNQALLLELVGRCPRAVATTEAHGMGVACREAAAMAVLGALCQDRVPITLPQVTGVRGEAPVAGSWVLP